MTKTNDMFINQTSSIKNQHVFCWLGEGGFQFEKSRNCCRNDISHVYHAVREFVSEKLVNSKYMSQ